MGKRLGDLRQLFTPALLGALAIYASYRLLAYASYAELLQALGHQVRRAKPPTAPTGAPPPGRPCARLLGALAIYASYRLLAYASYVTNFGLEPSPLGYVSNPPRPAMSGALPWLGS